jgi:hypothetical protein
VKKTHIWRNHITIPSLDNTVLMRDPSETLETTLVRLRRLSIPTGAEQIEVHDDVRIG